jgi:hypothetical protein
MLREPAVAGIGQLAAMQTAAPSFGVELQPIVVSDAGDIERALADFAHAPNGSLIVPNRGGSNASNRRHESIRSAACRLWRRKLRVNCNVCS